MRLFKKKRRLQIYTMSPPTPFVSMVTAETIKRMVYVCSPYRADTQEEKERNINYARELTRKVIQDGHAPITPHLYMTQCINDDNPEERQQGLAAGIELLSKCDCIIIGAKYGISAGMEKEIEAAERNGIRIKVAMQLT